MKKTLFLVTLTFIFVSASYGQFGDVLKKVTKEVTKVDLLEEKNVTTSIDDALPVAFWLKDLHDYDVPIEPDVYNFELVPGYYKFRVQSYCLKAGTHGPTKGSGYLLSPLKGKRSDLVYNIVKRSVNHPEIEQHDIQVLLWGIIYNTKFTDYPLEYQNKMRPLLTTTDMADLSLDLKNVPLDLMPEDIKNTARYYQDLRTKLTNPNLAYSELENATMLNGVLPEDPFSKFVSKGLWAYIGNGFYARALPEAYPTTVLEIYRPAFINVVKDAKGRIASLERDGNKIEITYDDDPGRDILVNEKGNFPIWRFKNIKLSGNNAGEEMNLENTGWMVRGNGLPVKNNGQSYNNNFNISDDPGYGDFQQRMNDGQKSLKSFNDYQTEKKLKPLKDKQAEYWADYHTMQGLKAATNPLDKKGQMNWIEKTLKLTMDWWNNANGALSGEENTDNGSKKADVSRNPAVPATNGMQRLIPSERRQNN